MSTWRSRSPRGASPCKNSSTYTSTCTSNVYIGIYKASEDATMLAFLNQLEALDAFAEKHLDLATKAAAP